MADAENDPSVSAGAPFALAGRAAASEIVEKKNGLLLLHLWGRLPPGWAGALSLGLSRRDVAIRRGFARKTARGHWIAEFELRSDSSRADPRSINYVALAMSHADGAGRVPITLKSYHVDRTSEIGGALSLEVKGEDRVGFLGSLLDSLASLSLFPEEMQVETVGDVAFDRLHLRSTGGRSPSDAARRALDGLLATLARPVVADLQRPDSPTG